MSNTMTLDWKEYEALAREAVREGMVLLKNDKNVLPLSKDVKLAVFGRMQNKYYKSGTGSGGMVNVPKVWSIIDGLKEENIALNEELLKVYEEFVSEHPFDPGIGFGNEPWSQEEMELSDELLSKVRSSANGGRELLEVPDGVPPSQLKSDGHLRQIESEFHELV